MLGSNEFDVSYHYDTLASFQYIRRIPPLYYSLPKKPLGRCNLVNPLLSMNEAWIDECAARLQPLVDQYKPRQHQTFAIEKIPRFDRNNPIMSWGKKFSFKKFINDLFGIKLIYLRSDSNFATF